ncbi:hypothetical protein [Iningainema tapete]|uniref:hypothetical protein n=1 Tax=Iningainema tapete TaxID=2806730 RepID=UPI00192E2855|nr:hypothetical protein [Iningainema tapete]
MTSEYIHPSPIWRPYTQMKTAPIPMKVVKGKGVFLELEDGRQILDCIFQLLGNYSWA